MRTLPLRLAPVDGESLPGYVARYSHTFQFPPGDLIRLLGLDGGTGTVAAAGRYGVWLSPDRLAHVAFATGIELARVERMLLACYAGLAFDRSAISAPVALAGAAQAHEVLIWCSRFCPRCLRDDGAWRLSWQLGWSTVCIRHQALLARRCPTCNGVPEIGPRGRWQQDHRGLLTDPARCSHRPARRLCRADLANANTVSIAGNAALLAAQRRVDALLDGELKPTLAGVQLPPPIYLRDLLTLCNLLDRHPQPPALGASRHGRRLHDHPEALAAVLPEALGLADLPDPEALAEALRELADRRYRADGRTLLATKSGPMSEHLQAVMRHAVSQAVWVSPSRQLGLHPSAHRRAHDLDDRLHARHVPQLFWTDDYQREIAELFQFDDFTHWLGRRFCSVLLARMLKPLDWHAAVRYLDFPERFINEGYNTTFAKLRTNGRFDELSRRVKTIANQHAAEHDLIDYKQRRALLRDWEGINLDYWHLLQPRPWPLSPFWRTDAPVRRRRASLWLWCHLTSGHERAAPIPLTRRGLFDQTEFIRDALPTLRERLLILGEMLLETPCDARSTLLNRLAATLHQRGYLAENYKLATIDPLTTKRVLAHVSAHTGIDIPSLTTSSIGSHAPPAVTHARLLATRLLRRTALPSYTAIARAIGGDGNHLADNDRRYRTALEHDPRLAGELDHLALAIKRWRAPAPTPPGIPHNQRMRDIAITIRELAAEALKSSHGHLTARLTSTALCRNHTDLTCPEIASIHNVKDAESAFAHATVARYLRTDPDYEHRYRQLFREAQRLRRAAGYQNANLRRGLTSQPAATDSTQTLTGN